MPIRDIYSKRQKRLRGEMPDVYVYDDLPRNLRVQIVRIWERVLGTNTYNKIVDMLRDEYGVFKLPSGSAHPRAGRTSKTELREFFLDEPNIDRTLDPIEESFKSISSDYPGSSTGTRVVQELNQRFREHGVGYQFEGGKIIRSDSEYIHTEVVRPALALLQGQQYTGAQDEFLQAHEDYRMGRSKDALNKCLNAIESVLKAICDNRGWDYGSCKGASDLINLCFDNQLIDNFWQSHFNALRSLLESGVPTARNKLSGHGQGTKLKEVPDHIVAYVLHMTASAIVFLTSADDILS